MRLKETIVGVAVATGLAAGAVGISAATAGADPMPPPAPGMPGMPMVPAAPPAGPSVASAPAWAPPKPLDPVWANGSRQVWDAGWQHWGVWMNGVFIPTF